MAFCRLPLQQCDDHQSFIYKGDFPSFFSPFWRTTAAALRRNTRKSNKDEKQPCRTDRGSRRRTKESVLRPALPWYVTGPGIQHLTLWVPTCGSAKEERQSPLCKLCRFIFAIVSPSEGHRKRAAGLTASVRLLSMLPLYARNKRWKKKVSIVWLMGCGRGLNSGLFMQGCNRKTAAENCCSSSGEGKKVTIYNVLTVCVAAAACVRLWCVTIRLVLIPKNSLHWAYECLRLELRWNVAQPVLLTCPIFYSR